MNRVKVGLLPFVNKRYLFGINYMLVVPSVLGYTGW